MSTNLHARDLHQLPSWSSHTPVCNVGDFNCQRVDWGYSKTSPDGESLDSWATVNNLWLLYDAKEAASFSFGRWNVGTNPDLAFASVGQDNRLLDRRVLGKFPRSQHRPSLITPPKLKVPDYSDPVKKWNFRKADWKRLPSHRWIRWEIATFGHNTTNIERHTKNFARAYYPRPNNISHMGVARTMCHAETKRGRPSITPSPKPRWGLTLIEPLCLYFRRSNRRSRSDGEKLSIPSTSRTLAARHGAPLTNLLAGLDAPLTCAPSHQTPPPHSLWRAGHTKLGAATPPGSSTRRCPPYGRFQHLKETAETVSLALSGQRSLQTPEARKVAGVGLHLPEVYTLRRVGSQILVLRFLQFLLATQNSKDLEKSTNCCDPKSRKAIGGPKELSPHTPSVCSFMTSRDSSTLVSYESSTYCFHRSRRAFDTGGRPQTRSPCWHRTSRIAFRLKRRPELCLSTSQQPTTLYGTAASPASCCDCWLIDTWSIWSWRWLAIAVSHSTPETTNEAGYDASRTTSHRDPSWHPFFSTSASLICQTLSPESMHMLKT